MSLTQPPSSTSSPHAEVRERPTPASSRRGHIVVILLLAALLIVAATVWQILGSINSTDPRVAGHPLSNPGTHLHTVALGDQAGTIYLGTHYGMFTSTDGGRSWPQSRGALHTLMITSIAVSPADPRSLAVMALPINNLSERSGVYFSRDGGSTWQSSSPPHLSSTAYPFAVHAGTGSAGHFYAFYVYAGWYETRDLGTHWKAITNSTLSSIQTPSLLTDPSHPEHLLLGGDQGLYETYDDGGHWQKIGAVSGRIWNITATSTTPRLIFCVGDQGIYRWQEGSTSVTLNAKLAMADPPTRFATNTDGSMLYGISGHDLWFSSDKGATWTKRWHFDREDMMAFLVDPRNPDLLYAGFYMPASVSYSTDGGRSWRILTS